MRVLFVHPSPLMYSEIYLRLEPLGMERVAAATRAAGHDVRILDLQIFKHRDLFAELESFKPQAVGFSLNYLANVPEVIDLAKDVKRVMKDCFVFTGGHSGSFVADEILEHADGAIDAIIRGEGETATPMLLARRFTLNPVLVVFSFVFWFWLWGVPGAILSAPILATTKIVCDRIRPLAALGHVLSG